MSRWDSFPCLRKRQQVFSLWGTTAAPWWGGWLVGVCKAAGSPVGCGTFLSGPRLDVAPAHPRGACVARGGAAARPCLWEAVATPLWGSAPCTPLSQTPSVLQRAPHPRQGFEPPSATPQSGGSAGTGVVLLGNGPPWHWQGYFWLRWSSSKEQEQRQEQCWALPQVPHALPQIVPLQLLHILPWQSSWDEKQPLCLCAGVQGTEQCEIYSAVPGSCSWVLKGLGAGGAPWQ